MKELHFYTNLCDELQTPEKELDDMHVDYVSTVEAMNNDDVVKTTVMSFLSNIWDYYTKGIKVFIHLNDNNTVEIYK